MQIVHNFFVFSQRFTYLTDVHWRPRRKSWGNELKRKISLSRALFGIRDRPFVPTLSPIHCSNCHAGVEQLRHRRLFISGKFFNLSAEKRPAILFQAVITTRRRQRRHERAQIGGVERGALVRSEGYRLDRGRNNFRFEEVLGRSKQAESVPRLITGISLVARRSALVIRFDSRRDETRRDERAPWPRAIDMDARSASRPRVK